MQAASQTEATQTGGPTGTSNTNSVIPDSAEHPVNTSVQSGAGGVLCSFRHIKLITAWSFSPTVIILTGLVRRLALLWYINVLCLRQSSWYNELMRDLPRASTRSANDQASSSKAKKEYRTFLRTLGFVWFVMGAVCALTLNISIAILQNPGIIGEEIVTLAFVCTAFVASLAGVAACFLWLFCALFNYEAHKWKIGEYSGFDLILAVPSIWAAWSVILAVASLLMFTVRSPLIELGIIVPGAMPISAVSSSWIAVVVIIEALCAFVHITANIVLFYKATKDKKDIPQGAVPSSDVQPALSNVRPIPSGSTVALSVTARDTSEKRTPPVTRRTDSRTLAGLV